MNAVPIACERVDVMAAFVRRADGADVVAPVAGRMVATTVVDARATASASAAASGICINDGGNE
jgi:hypothetical protein